MYLKLLVTLLKINLQQDFAYRADTIVNILVNLMWLGWELLSLQIIFSNTDTLGGWDLGALIALLGIFRLLNALMAALLWPSTERFNEAIRNGTLDYTLLRPANSLFLITFERIVVWRIWDLALAAALIAVGLTMTGAAFAGINLLTFLLLAASGAAIIYSLWVMMIAFTFWFIKFDNNVTILQALLEAGRYPATVYPTWLRLIVTFVVPVAVATTVPLQALRGELPAWQIALALGIGAASLFAASRMWRLGIRRYSGASS